MRRRKVVLVTGGCGYVGSVLVRRLSRLNYSVRVLDNLFFGNTVDNVKNVEVINEDIRHIQNHIFENVDTIIHLAAISNDETADLNPSTNFEINTKATKSLANNAKRSGVKRFIFASSSSIYDIDTNENNVKNEDSNVNPTRAYSVSKYQAERELLKIADEKFCVTIFRMGTIFGFSPRMRYDLVVNAMVKDALLKGLIKIFSKGLQWRPLIDVNDVAKAYCLALNSPSQKINKQIINISLENFLIKDVAVIIQKTLLDSFNILTKIIYKDSKTQDRSYKMSNQKAKLLLKFTPSSTITNSVIKLVKKIRNYKSEDISNPIYYNIAWMKSFLSKELTDKVHLQGRE